MKKYIILIVILLFIAPLIYGASVLYPYMGGTGQDTSGWTGFAYIASGTWSNVQFVDNETPSGALDGSNTVFTLANTPKSGTEKVYLDGLRWIRDDGYTISGATITLVIAPESDETLLVDYRY